MLVVLYVSTHQHTALLSTPQHLAHHPARAKQPDGNAAVTPMHFGTALHKKLTGHILGVGAPKSWQCICRHSASVEAGNSGSPRSSSPRMQPSAQQSMAVV